MKKIIAISATLTLFISAVSCAKNSADSEFSTAEISVSQTMYKQERISMPDNMRSYLGGEYVEDAGVRLCFADDKGDVYYSDYSENGEFTPPEPIFSADGHCETYASVCPDGSIALLVMTVVSDGELYTEEYFANAKASFEIYRYAPNGALENTVDANELNRYFDIRENDVILGFYAVNDSYVVSFGGGHILMSSDGSVENADSDFSRMGFAADASGKVCSASRDGFVCGDGVELSITENARKFGDYLTLKQGIRTGHDGFGLFFLLNDGVFGLTEKGNIVEILDYADSLASCADQYDVIYAGTGKFLAVGHNDIGTYLSVFTVRPDDYKMERRDVIVGTDHGEWGDYNELISAYNKRSDSYFAKVKNYGEELDGLKAAILSGDPPDLYIYTDPEYMHRLVNVGAAADMYALSEKYGGFGREDILDNIIKAYEYKNGLYMMSQ